MTDPSWQSLVPAIVAVATAVVIRRPIESLLAGVFAGLLLLEPAASVANFSSILLEVMMDETIAWVIIVCGLMGSLIVLLMRAGAANAFSHALASKAKSAGSALLYTWLLGLLIFIDDYLNALAVGSAMRKVTDKFRVSREMLAYVVDSTAAPICVLVPVSTWAVFFAGVLEVSDVAEPGEGLALYISSIPYMLYPLIAALMVPLVATGRIPALGMMKAAQAKATANGNATHQNEFAVEEIEDSGRVRIYHFLLPVVAMLGFSIWYDLDVQIGITMAVAATIVLYGVQRLLTWTEMFDAVLEGIKIMVPALTIVVVAFMFKEVNDRLGLPIFVIEGVTPYMTATLLPLVVFITMALISFATGSSWGVFAIAIPIVLPLAESVGVDAPLAIGALISASAFGSHACFYSDATVLSAQGSGCGVMEHALTQIPYALIAAVIAGTGLTLLAAI
ncbi:MAG: sodium:proton antiporter [Gammaproteobacteria bacterium]|nr:sodium:proton antiporter [Gammaproteobacteria bacterium]MBT5155647.1 sodium:proton antiporter [Gammaproteobacteria bacterium]MBT5685969.1 sodium:proton antiporter [Gammaproteobacteria bacterium]MBT5722517.1 sodium:proton antiporter [Gammaproteobacteria bacterium]MBT6584873.1 sodium:proton antiporter [Gammaproteobacteria bacterium]